MTAAEDDGGLRQLSPEEAEAAAQAQESRTRERLARRGDSPRSSLATVHPLTRRPSTGDASRPARRGRPGNPARSPASPAPATSAKGKRGYLARAFSPSSAAKRAGLGKVAAAGDAGGLLLAIVLYPLALSFVKFGTAGPGIWFRAKWLNQDYTPGAEKEAVRRSKRKTQGFYVNSPNYVDPDGNWYRLGQSNSPWRITKDGRRERNPLFNGGATRGNNGGTTDSKGHKTVRA